MARHHFQINVVGPYVFATCSCLRWSCRRVKALSAEVVAAAREHAVKANATIPQPPQDKYEELSRKVIAATSEERNKAYKRVQLAFGVLGIEDSGTCDKAVIHGGNLMQRSPRGAKHNRMVINGVRAR